MKRGSSKEASSSGLGIDLLVPGLLGPIGRIIEGEAGPEVPSSEDRKATQAFCAELDIGALDRLLDRCRYSKDLSFAAEEDEPEPSFESMIFRAFGWPLPPAGHDWPVAALTAMLDRPNPSTSLGSELVGRKEAASFADRAEGMAEDETETRAQKTGSAWLRADPVHLLAGLDDLVLGEPCSMDSASPFALDRAQADALVQVVNDALEPQGPFVVAPHPLRWYVALEAPPRMKTAAPSTAIGKALSSRLPRGLDAAFWHRWSNLVQMALHECPTNLARTEIGAPPINSLWLWGGRLLPAPRDIPPKAFECVWSDDPLVRALACLPDVREKAHEDAHEIESDASDRPAGADEDESDGSCRPAPVDAADWLARTKSPRDRSQRHLIVHDALFACAKRSDPQRWREGVEDFSARWAAPLLDGLRSGRFARLSIVDEYGHRFTASASSVPASAASWRRWWPGQKRGLAGAMADALATSRDRTKTPSPTPSAKKTLEIDDRDQVHR